MTLLMTPTLLLVNTSLKVGVQQMQIAGLQSATQVSLNITPVTLTSTPVTLSSARVSLLAVSSQ